MLRVNPRKQRYSVDNARRKVEPFALLTFDYEYNARHDVDMMEWRAMSWDGYLYRLKSQEEELFKMREELEREVREIARLFESENALERPAVSLIGGTLQ